MKMKLENCQYKTHDNNIINYYETDSNNHILLIIHAQSANSSSYSSVIKKLSKKFHLIIIDCYGHGKSSHNKEKYNIISQGDDLIEFIQYKTAEKYLYWVTPLVVSLPAISLQNQIFAII